ncbi:MAG: PKD domain-containing protein [Saprospiraceae bacterium]
MGQEKRMVVPLKDGLVKNTNKGSDMISTPIIGSISPKQMDYDWGIGLKNVQSFFHTSPVDKQTFNQLKDEANQKRDLRKKSPIYISNQTDSLMPYLNKNFRGNVRGSSVPMDNTVAVSRNGFIVSAINTNVIFTQPDGQTTFTKDLSDFFFLLNLGTRMYDPRVIYDTEQNKFIFMCLHGSDPASTQLCLAFSKTEDPNGEWNFYKIDGNPGDENNWFDYPNIAVSTHDFYLAGLMRNNAGDWQYSVLYQMDKMDGFEGKTMRWKHYNELFDADQKPSFNLVPCPSGWSDLVGPGMYFVSNEALGGEKYNLYFTNESLHNNPVLNSLQTTGPVTMLAPDGRQKGTSERLNTFDSRIWSAMYLNGQIHMGSHVNTPNGDVGLFYGRMNIEDFEVYADVLVTDSIDYGFPSFSSFGTTPESDSVLVNYLYTGPTLFPGQQQRICFGKGDSFVWSNPTTLKQGETIVSVLTENRERWGDYTTSGRRFVPGRIETWVTGCYGEGGSYGTWLGQYVYSDSLEIKIIPDFTANETTVEKGSMVQFKDISKIEGDSLLWIFPGGNPAFSIEKSPTVLYPENGAYDVTMVVKKGEVADSISKIAYIHVQDAETIPVADFRYDLDTIFRNDTVQFYNLSSQNTVLLRWTFTQGAPGASVEENPRVRYPLKGSYGVSLSALNIAGTDVKTVLKAITVLDRFAPTAAFTSNKTQIMPGESIQFSDISSGGPTSREWSFEGGQPSSSNLKNPVVAYTNEGIFSVTLKVKNNLGENEVIKTEYIRVGQSSTKEETTFFIKYLYPNPSSQNDRVSVQFNTTTSGVYSFEILDINGRQIKKLMEEKVKVGDNVVQFNTSHLSSGQYYFCIVDENGINRMMPFVVVK